MFIVGRTGIGERWYFVGGSGHCKVYGMNMSAYRQFSVGGVEPSTKQEALFVVVDGNARASGICVLCEHARGASHVLFVVSRVVAN